MHQTEALLSKQLQMKFGVIENALTQLIQMHTNLFGEVEMLKRKVDNLSRSGVVSQSEEQNQQNDGDDDNDLDISQVQRILKQQSSGPSSFGRKM